MLLGKLGRHEEALNCLKAATFGEDDLLKLSLLALGEAEHWPQPESGDMAGQSRGLRVGGISGRVLSPHLLRSSRFLLLCPRVPADRTEPGRLARMYQKVVARSSQNLPGWMMDEAKAFLEK